MTTLVIPMPPSVNALFANVPSRGRVRTRAYKTWSTEAGWQLRTQAPLPSYDGDVAVSIRFGPRDRRRDLDNLAKACLDLLTEHRVLSDDSAVVALSLAWCPETRGAAVTVEAA